MNEQNIALKLDDVEFRRRRRVILTKVNLEVKKGEKWVLFGPNGIGKSTLVQMMSTRGFPSEGTVDILGNRLGKVNVVLLPQPHRFELGRTRTCVPAVRKILLTPS